MLERMGTTLLKMRWEQKTFLAMIYPLGMYHFGPSVSGVVIFINRGKRILIKELTKSISILVQRTRMINQLKKQSLRMMTLMKVSYIGIHN